MTEVDIQLLEAAMFEREAGEFVAKATTTPSPEARASWFSCARIAAQQAERAMARAMELEQKARYPKAFAY